MSLKSALFFIIIIAIILFGVLYVIDPILYCFDKDISHSDKAGMEFGKRFWTVAIFIVVWGLIGFLYAEAIGKKLPKWSTPISFSITFILTLLIFMAICG